MSESPRLIQPFRASTCIESNYVPHTSICWSNQFTRFQTLLQLSTGSPGQVAPAPTSIDAKSRARKPGQSEAGLGVRGKSASREVSCASNPTLDARPSDTVALLGHKGTQGNFRLNDRRSREENSSGWHIGSTVEIRKDPSHQQRVSEEEGRVGFSGDQQGEGASAVQVSAATPVDPLSAMLTENGRVSVTQLLVYRIAFGVFVPFSNPWRTICTSIVQYVYMFLSFFLLI